MNGTVLDKDNILNMLSEHSATIKLFGVKDLGIFGSVARGESSLESDIDFVVTFNVGEKNFDNLINLADFLEDLLKTRVDLLTYESLRPRMRARVDEDIVHVALLNEK